MHGLEKLAFLHVRRSICAVPVNHFLELDELREVHFLDRRALIKHYNFLLFSMQLSFDNWRYLSLSLFSLVFLDDCLLLAVDTMIALIFPR